MLIGIAGGLAAGAALILPDASLDVVCYACTSGSLVIGEKRVFEELRNGAPKARPTSLITGVIRALRVLDARRIVVGTPYLDEINEMERRYLEDAGFEVRSVNFPLWESVRADADEAREFVDDLGLLEEGGGGDLH